MNLERRLSKKHHQKSWGGFGLGSDIGVEDTMDLGQ